MKRPWTAGEIQDGSELEPPAKRTARDAFATTPDAAAQPWTQLFTSILGVDGSRHESDVDMDPDDRLDVMSVPVLDIGPELSLGHSNLEKVGRCIETWADATMIQCEKAQRQEGEVWPLSIDGTNGEASDPLQCFGMIHECRARLYGDMQNLQQRLDKMSQTKTRAQLQFVTASDTGFLSFEDDTLCAQLGHLLHDPLERVSQVKSTRLLAYVAVENWVKIIGRARRHKDAETQVDINVYGLASVRLEIGQMLSEEGLYLQDIKHCEMDVEYKNPHMLEYEHFEQDDQDMEIDEMHSENRTAKEVQQTILDVCFAETEDRHFREEQGYFHVTVPLYSHQKQAVSFMVEREVGPIKDDAKLWKWTQDEARSGFRNVITGSWAADPRQEGGSGILADDPGMGKTLSILSLIGQRLADAQKWSQSHNETLKTYGRTSIRSKATLVVVPSLPVMDVWLEQMKKFMDSSLKVVKYHGRLRHKRVEKMAEADIVLTTYYTLAVERRTNKSSLKSIEWFRIVLDEAHYIRRQATTLYAAVTELDARHRWCLTGTPIQNRLEDLGALLAFIRMDPFESIAMFRKHVVSPFSYDLGRAKEKLSLLLNSISIRRRIKRLQLPPIKERRHYVELSPAEEEQYKKTLNSMLWEMSHGSREKYAGTPFGKFQIQLRLRRLCNHGTFQGPWAASHHDIQAQREDVISSIGKDGEVICSSCHEPVPILAAFGDISRPLQTQSHVLCDECKNADFVCSITATETDSGGVVSREGRSCLAGLTTGGSLEQPDMGFVGYSSKMNMLMRDVEDDFASTKSIIFSSWTRSLDLVQLHLQRLSIAYMRVDGNTEPSKRQPTFDAFRDDNNTRVLLMTTGTGAYGLNLTIANRIFILEPQWNPSIEVQAIARAQRLSQKQSVLVTRYVVRGTIEEDILRQQGSKMNIAEMGYRASDSDDC